MGQNSGTAYNINNAASGVADHDHYSLTIKPAKHLSKLNGHAYVQKVKNISA